MVHHPYFFNLPVQLNMAWWWLFWFFCVYFW